MKEKQFLQIFVILLLLFLIKAVYKLQITQGANLKNIAENNYVRIEKIQPNRGRILDAEYNPIVKNIPANHLFVTPAKIKNKSMLFDFLKDAVNIEKKYFSDLLHKYRYYSHREILLKEDLSRQQVVTILENIDMFTALSIKSLSVRKYLSQNHFTGYVGKINDREYKVKKDKNYSQNDYIGKIGLEKKYETLLRGEVGYKVTQVDAIGNNLNLLKHDLKKDAVNGNDIVLTINCKLQEYCTSLLQEYEEGAIVVLNSKTGGVLSYVSLPTYDQNLFVTGFSNKQWKSINENPAHPMLDRIIHATYPPGSIFKPLVLGVGLEKNYIEKDTKLSNCDGGFDIGNRYFKCWLESGHGKTNSISALKYSCDVYFYDLSLMLKLSEIKEAVENSFLITPTGIDLMDERNGFFPDRGWYKKNYGKYAGIIGPKANISIGQGEILTSPLQMCCYYNAIANDGIWRQPFLIKTILNNKDSQSSFNRDTKRLPLSANSLSIIQEGLFEVVNGKWGTGYKAKVNGIKIWGKTGSAENHQGKDTHAWFAGYAGRIEPEITFTVLVENAGHGGSIAAPITQKLISYYYSEIDKLNKLDKNEQVR